MLHGILLLTVVLTSRWILGHSWTRVAIFPSFREKSFSDSNFQYLLSLGEKYHEIFTIVDVLVHSDFLKNFLNDKKQEKLKKINVNLKSVSCSNNKIVSSEGIDDYEVLIVMSDSIIPTVYGIGSKFNIYMYQNSLTALESYQYLNRDTLNSFNMVMINFLTEIHIYMKPMHDILDQLIIKDKLFPTINVLYPPIEQINTFSLDFNRPAVNKSVDQIHIIMFDEIVKDKRIHLFALDILSEIVQQTTKTINLHILVPFLSNEEHNNHIQEIKNIAIERNLTVDFISKTTENIENVMSQSLIQWHFTGIGTLSTSNLRNDERKSIISFLIFAMNQGSIPIIFNRSILNEFINSGVNGFKAQVLSEFVAYTLQILSFSKEERVKMQDAMKAFVKSHFSFEEHWNRLKVLTIRGILASTFRSFERENIQILRDKSPKSLSRTAKNAAVIVEPMIHSDFEFCVRNVILHLSGDWTIQVHHSKVNARFVKHVLNDIANIQYITLPHLVRDTLEYNKLLRSTDFWDATNAEKVLIFQSDSVMLRSGISEFLDYDYIGAPWDVNNNLRVSNMIKDGSLKTSVGNGGFSLRSKSAMNHIIEAYGDKVPLDFQEDMFFSKFSADLGYKVAPPDVAYRFSKEVRIDQYALPAGEMPLGLHAAWFYMPESETLNMLNRSMEGIK